MFTVFTHHPLQAADSDDEVEGFPDSDDTQPSGESFPLPSQEGISTYGDEDLVPEPQRVCCFQAFSHNSPYQFRVDLRFHFTEVKWSEMFISGSY